MQTFFHRWTPRLLPLAALGFLFAAAGCGDEAVGTPGADETFELTMNLEDPYGGTDTADEAPAFGDDYIASILSDDEPVVLDEEPALDDDGRTVLFLRAVWGRRAALPETSGDERPDCGMTTWDGSLAVSDGVLRPLRTIRFERFGPYADALVLPRTSRSEIEWTSVTGCGNDGVLVKIVVPAAADSVGNGDGLTADDEVTFATGPLTISFPLGDLAELDSLVMVDDVNGVRFTGFDRDDLQDTCRRGRLRGVWAKSDTDDHRGGYFRGAWMDPVGQVWGHVRGRWGVDAEGRQVFVGKVIRRDGRYAGHVRGLWDTAPGGGDGPFGGVWVIGRRGADPERHVGGLRGEWTHGRRDGDLTRGGWYGVWGSLCNRHVEDDMGGDMDPHRERNGATE
jgi:hypothetical protein